MSKDNLGLPENLQGIQVSCVHCLSGSVVDELEVISNLWASITHTDPPDVRHQHSLMDSQRCVATQRCTGGDRRWCKVGGGSLTGSVMVLLLVFLKGERSG